MSDNYDLIIKQIQENLTPDLLKVPYREKNKTNPMFGHCYVATETLYYLLNDSNRYCPARGRDEDNVVHWWLVDKHNNIIIDVTKDQYYSINKIPPYDQGKRSGFLTNTPSKRSLTLLNKLKGIHNDY